MRARNTPTNGPQASQNAQKNSVQPPIHSAPSGSSANVASVRAGSVIRKRPMFSTSALAPCPGGVAQDRPGPVVRRLPSIAHRLGAMPSSASRWGRCRVTR